MRLNANESQRYRKAAVARNCCRRLRIAGDRVVSMQADAGAPAAAHASIRRTEERDRHATCAMRCRRG
ncbi:hypothetical protein CFB89_16130 [Burkholderia sp. AU16741]|nr:hypothetical protein CFB89_16130 [Burkholderia sp. AU16741]